MKLEEIQNLIQFVSDSGVSEVDIQQKDFRIIIKTEHQRLSEAPMIIHQTPAAAPMPATSVAAPAAAPASPAGPAKEETLENSKYIEVKSPMIGTFYRKPSPDKPTFVEVGDTIKPGDVVCIIEAMKLFNEIEAEISGKVVKVLVDDSSPVEYDQPLFLIDPS